jgi:outer membrane receptor protein involved in Fe transport
VQLVASHPLRGRFNQFIVGAAVDLAWTEFGFGAEYASLSPVREAIGTGIDDPSVAVDLDTRKHTYSLFLSDTVRVAPRLHVTGSARMNWTAVTLRDQLGTALDGDHRFQRLNPAAGLTFDATSSLNLYGGYAQSSRVPTPVELTCADPEDPCRLPNAFVSDPPLAQVVAGTWEVGARGRASAASWTVAAFSTRVRDDLIFVSSGTMRGEGHFENVSSTRRAGIETAFDLSLGRVDLSATYTYQQATFGADLRIASPFHPEARAREIAVQEGDTLPAVPSQIARVGVSARLGAGVDVAGSARMQSSQYLRGDEANLLATLPGFTVVDARLRWQVQRRLSLVAQVHNLLDATYATFGALGDAELLGERYEDDPRFHSPGAPRAGWVGIEIAF